MYARHVEHHSVELHQARDDAITRVTTDGRWQISKDRHFVRDLLQGAIVIGWQGIQTGASVRDSFTHAVEMLWQAVLPLFCGRVCDFLVCAGQPYAHSAAPRVERLQDIVLT